MAAVLADNYCDTTFLAAFIWGETFRFKRGSAQDSLLQPPRFSLFADDGEGGRCSPGRGGLHVILIEKGGSTLSLAALAVAFAWASEDFSAGNRFFYSMPPSPRLWLGLGSFLFQSTIFPFSRENDTQDPKDGSEHAR
uniref:Uncharacterized protein n=1 Tax=Oryza brachyantha TaxID=4533 RepID=J3KWE0_ORYBR